MAIRFNNFYNYVMIEILTIQLNPGTRDAFHQLYLNESLPLQKKWNINVVAHGPSLHDADTYFVVRRFDNLADRQVKKDAFYNSDDWLRGPQTAMLDKIEQMSNLVVAEDAISTWLNSSLPLPG